MDSLSVSFFVGEFVHSVDDKGRITIPSKWRIKGDDSTYLALSNPGGYVIVYPPRMVARLEEKVAEARMSDASAQVLLMELFSKAHSFGCDKQGRINLTDKLLVHASIRKKAVLVGSGTFFTVWGEKPHGERPEATERNIFDAMRDLGL